MTPQEFALAQEHVQQCWYALIQAEQQGASMQTLERLYASYIASAEAYNRCCETYQQHSGLPQKSLLFKRAG